MKKLAMLVVIAALCSMFTGCASYSGGKVVDGTNLEVGMTVPGTEWSINFLAFTGGAIIKGNNQTRITVTNEVCETNSYFAVVKTQRHTKLTAIIEPCEDGASGAGYGDEESPADRNDGGRPEPALPQGAMIVPLVLESKTQDPAPAGTS